MKTLSKKLIIRYLENQAKRLIAKHQPKIIAVAGSVGKTSTKLAIAEVLRGKYTVLAHPSSYNGEISLPLSLFDIRVPERLVNPVAWAWLLTRIHFRYRNKYPYEIVVLELGADKPGDISYFMRYLKPEIGVITAVTPEHMEGFGSMEAVLDEEFKLARHAKYILLNASDVMLNVKKKDLKPEQVRTFGVERGDYWFQIKKHDLNGFSGRLHLGKDGWFQTKVAVLGRQNLFAVTAAASVGSLLGLTQDQLKTQVARIRPFAGRMQRLAGKNSSFIIDDSYNSSPDAAIAAINALYELPAKRRIAVLGSMNELGDYSKEAHQNVARWCTKLDFLVTVGQEAKDHLVPEAIASGLAKSKIKSFLSPYDAGRFLQSKLQPGDVVLVKGSQNRIYLEETIKYLLADKADQSKLVRQNAFWQRLKRKQFALQ